MKPQEKIFMVVGTVAVMAAACWGGYTLFVVKDPETQTSTTSYSTPATSSSAATTSPLSTASSSMSSYKDGAYTATANYRVPHGTNTLSVTATISNGAITNVSVNHDYNDGESAMYIDSFNSSIDGTVKGQPLADVSIGRVGGASLTSEAFNSVLDTIRSDAKA